MISRTDAVITYHSLSPLSSLQPTLNENLDVAKLDLHSGHIIMRQNSSERMRGTNDIVYLTAKCSKTPAPMSLSNLYALRTLTPVSHTIPATFHHSITILLYGGEISSIPCPDF